MDIECVCFGPIREAVGTKTVVRTVDEGATVGELLTDLDRNLEGFRDAALTDDGELREGIVVTVNTDNVRQLDGTATALADGDTVRITPQIRGGGATERVRCRVDAPWPGTPRRTPERRTPPPRFRRSF
jgi:molybdopterin synthase sulfur carrier subunit